nr:ABC transporter ATP-binding protein [uncultured Niameybacter sp.]
MYVEVKDLNKSFGSYRASKNVNFGIEQGQLVGLLGPSGSGKTTILRMIAGLETPESGDIIINGRRVNDIEPGKRGIGFVFQNYALFRHMSVYDNIAFGLDIQKVPKVEKHKRVMELIELIGLKGLEKRLPHQLSGGQKQRVAFARALAPRPNLLLLDEPFAAIDAKVRKELRSWLKEMVKKLNITSIFVTHDQEEAVEIADEIIVTNSGQVEQKGTPIAIYKEPKTPFVAQFIGESKIIENYRQIKGFEEEEHGIKAVVRPDFVEIHKYNREFVGALAANEGKVVMVSFKGSNLEVTVSIGDIELIGCRSLEEEELVIGEKVKVLVHRLYLFDESQTKIVENRLKEDPMPVFI